MSNEGGEHVDSDILGVHDYTADAEPLRARYAGRQAAVDAVLSAHGPQGRRPILSAAQAQKFLDGGRPADDHRVRRQLPLQRGRCLGLRNRRVGLRIRHALAGSFRRRAGQTQVTGFCYTQFRDTAQETNGLLFADGTAKLPAESIREIVTGVKDGAAVEAGSTFGWPG